MAKHGSYSTKTLKKHPPPPRQKLDIQNSLPSMFCISWKWTKRNDANRIIKMLHGYMWSLIPTFVACLGVESHTSPKHLLKMQTSFRRNSSPKHFWKCPKLERQDFWPRFLPPRPRASVVPLGVHRSPFGQQKLCSLHVAVERRRMERRPTSGAFSGKPSATVASGVGRRGRLRGNDGSCGQLSSTRSIDKRTMDVLDPTSWKLFKAKSIHKTHPIFLANDIAFNETIENKSITCFQA